MVERHIFTPGLADQKSEPEAPAKPVNSQDIEKELLFTGVMITPQGKQAVLKELGRDAKTKSAVRYKEGDAVKDYVIQEIGANYLLLASNHGSVQLKLYKGLKNRPAPAVIESPASNAGVEKTPSGKDRVAQAGGGPPTGTTPPAESSPNVGKPGGTGDGELPKVPDNSPFGGANKDKAMPPLPDGGLPPATNPFIEALKKVGEQQSAGNGGGGVGNPFLPGGGGN